MYYSFDKQTVRDAITDDDIFGLLEEWNGLPERRKESIVSRTICHNESGEGSHKLYYYPNTKLFQCYTNCGSFDIFELTQKVFKYQKGQDIDLNEAIRYLSIRFGVLGEANGNTLEDQEDWKIFADYNRIDGIEIKNYHAELPTYDSTILERFNHNVLIGPWLEEGISQEAIDFAQICYYPGGEQIVIPHFDVNGNLIGIRGRTLIQQEAELYGKYRPILANKTLYSHPLGFNLYGLNWAKENIKIFKKAIIFESEKSVLHYITDFGIENKISVACCGSNLSLYQLQLLKDLGVNEIVIAFDRQWEAPGTDEQKLWDKKLISLYNKVKGDVNVSFIYDNKMLTDYKASPIDESGDIFLTLFKDRKYIKEKV